MEKGILLIAFGKPAYAYMAENMARSIKHHSPNVKVALASDGVHNYCRDKSFFDTIIPFKPHKDAGHAKLQMFDLSPFDHTLYLDVDGMVLKDIEPLLDHCIADGRPVIADTNNEGGITDKINYAHWATNINAWAWFEIPLDGRFQSTQTSSLYFNKKSKPLQELIERKKHYPKKYLANPWGGATPDELIVSGCCAALGWDIAMDKKTIGSPVFFGFRIVPDVKDKNIHERGYVLSMYGNDRLVKLRYREMYDRLMHKISPQAYPRRAFMSSKHVS